MAAISITAANVTKTSTTQTAVGTAGETITAGMPVYLKTSDSRLWKADANDTAATATVVGISLHGASAGQPLVYAVPNYSLVIGATLVVGSWYFLGTTAGAIVPAGDITTSSYPTCIGYAASATDLFFLGVNPGVAYAGAGAFVA